MAPRRKAAGGEARQAALGEARQAAGDEARQAARDEAYMRMALELAARARGRTSPNPLVGCVIVRAGRVIATGYHRRAGLDHAEVDALGKLGGRARGATAYVSLEPCNHIGRTGKCTDALLAADVARVVCGMRDPNPRVAGGGIARLRAAKVAVTVGVLEDECRALNRSYIVWVTTGRPEVTLKAAITLDGRLAARSGDARWVSGAASRLTAHRMRDQADAILVGARTVRLDDPALTTRLPGKAGKNPLRVILDGRLTVSERAHVIRPGTLIATTNAAPARQVARLQARGVEVLVLPGARGRVRLGALLDVLGGRGVTTLLVEGGGQVHGQLLARGLVDRVALFLAPRLIGAGGVPLIDVAGPRTMAEAWRLEDVSTRRSGDDILLVGSVVRSPRRVHRDH